MSRDEACAFWARAKAALDAAEKNLAIDPFTAVNRAYYAAFYAVSALFALEELSFRKHSAVEAALHGQLVKTGRWSVERGADYRALNRLRSTGDYDVFVDLPPEGASGAVEKAMRILRAVQLERSDVFV